MKVATALFTSLLISLTASAESRFSMGAHGVNSVSAQIQITVTIPSVCRLQTAFVAEGPASGVVQIWCNLEGGVLSLDNSQQGFLSASADCSGGARNWSLRRLEKQTLFICETTPEEKALLSVVIL